MKKLLVTLPENLSSALGFTLLHSIWQGALLLIVFAAMHFILKSARSRYLLGMGTLLAQALISVITFAWIYSPAAVSSSVLVLENANLLLPAEMMGFGHETLLHTVQAYLAGHHQQFTVLWLLGVGILLCRTAIGLFYTRHLKTAGVREAGVRAYTLLNDLRQKLGMGEKIQLLESVKINLPVTIGWLKPVILFPVGMLSGLPADQLEAILAHELAHIQRRDYLFNILQNVIETFFFFHPAVWVISHRIRAERENCCDDIALQHCQSELVLANALAEVASFSSKPLFSMAFGARRYTLLDRVKRIIGIKQKPSLTTSNWISLTVLLSLCMAVWTYAREAEKTPPPPLPEMTPGATAVLPSPPVIPRDTFPKTATELAMDNLSMEMSQLSDQMSKYSDKMQGLSQKMHTSDMDKLSAEMSKLSEKMGEPSSKIGNLSEKIALLSLEVAAKKLKKENTAAMETELKTRQAEMGKVQKEMETLSEQMTVLGKKMEMAQKPLERLSLEMHQLSEPMDSLGKIMNQKGEEMNKLGEKLRQEYEENARAFNKTLGESGLVTDAANFTIDITASGSKINGKQLNEADAAKLLKILSTHFRIPGEYDQIQVETRNGETSYRIKNQNGYNSFRW